MSNMKNLYFAVSAVLKARYPNAVCALEYGGEAWKLLVMARLSAQCTDARVNVTARELFAKFPTVSALAEANLAEVEACVRPCGLFHVKARDIISECRDICDKFGGVVPETEEQLLSMSGVGRKIANLILGDLHGRGGVVCDTHFMRICGRLGFYEETLKNADKIEKIMNPVVPMGERADFCHRIVLFGREVCTAKNPNCNSCPLAESCKHHKGEAGK